MDSWLYKRRPQKFRNVEVTKFDAFVAGSRTSNGPGEQAVEFLELGLPENYKYAFEMGRSFAEARYWLFTSDTQSEQERDLRNFNGTAGWINESFGKEIVILCETGSRFGYFNHPDSGELISSWLP